MVTWMKTTVDLPDSLVREAKRVAAEEGTTLRDLVERGLRSVLQQRQATEGFRLRDASVDGNGLTPDWRGAGWERLRDAIYHQPAS